MVNYVMTRQEDIDACFDDWADDAPKVVPPRAEPPLSGLAPAAATAPIGALRLAPEGHSGFIAMPYANKPDHFPALFARTGLFRVGLVARSDVETGQAVEIKGQGRYGLRLEGPGLSMFDKRVYEAVIRLAKAMGHNTLLPMRVSLRDISDRMGWSSGGGRDLGLIWQSLARLSRCRLAFRLADGSQGNGLMIASAAKDAAGVSLAFDPGFVLAAFGGDKQFRIDTARRDALSSSMAKWLHDFVSTHTKAYPLDLGYLRSLSGFGAREKAFPMQLESALAMLVAAAPGLVASFAIAKPTKRSERWTLDFARGTQPVDFIDPAQAKRDVPRSAQGPRRGGVAL